MKGTVAKVIVVGDVATGKTSVIRRYVDNTFSPDHHTTIGVDFSLKQEIFSDCSINVQLWDIAGQERFVGLSQVYYRHASAAFVVFDATSRQTFEKSALWKKDIDAKVFLSNGEHIPVFLLANKADLLPSFPHSTTNSVELSSSSSSALDSYQPSVSDPISGPEITQFCEQQHFVKWYLTSAKTGYNINKSCHDLVTMVVDNNKKLSLIASDDSMTVSSVVELHNTTDNDNGCTNC